RGDSMDWGRLLRRFGSHWRVLFAHLVNFGFIYPTEREKVPGWVLQDLADRLHAENGEAASEGWVCRGTLLSREQYLPDIGVWGYRDARLRPMGQMSPEEVAHWTAAINAAQH
ncbi:MAG: hypothetical protein U0790_23085, partial [Isosphaeraceae bacterium]